MPPMPEEASVRENTKRRAHLKSPLQNTIRAESTNEPKPAALRIACFILFCLFLGARARTAHHGSHRVFLVVPPVAAHHHPAHRVNELDLLRSGHAPTKKMKSRRMKKKKDGPEVRNAAKIHGVVRESPHRVSQLSTTTTKGEPIFLPAFSHLCFFVIFDMVFSMLRIFQLSSSMFMKYSSLRR